MSDAREAVKATVWAEIDRRRDEWLSLLADVIRRPSDNPPGDTVEVAGFVRQRLEDAGIAVDVHEPLESAPNLVARVSEHGGRHLVLNGHLDQFPVENPASWTGSPYSADVREGRIYGRGSADMKAGTTALLAVSILMRELRVPLAGRLTLTLVSDEETGGLWGTKWLLDHHPELIGDAVLNAEPSSTEAVYVAEKGVFWLKVTTHSPGGHSGLSPLDNAIFKMSEAIQAGLELRGMRGTLPASLTDALTQSRELLDRRFGPGAGWVYDSVTLNVGKISGGVKANVVPAQCEAEFDFRLPLGITPERLLADFRAALRERGLSDADVTIEPLYECPPSHTDISAEIFQATLRNAEAVTGGHVQPLFMYGGSDCRYWRFQGVPAAIYGPRSYNMAAADEHVVVNDYVTVMKVHAGAIIDYLGVTS